MSSDHMQAAALLEGHGYVIRYAEAEWVTCAVFGHGETWRAEGLDRAAALDGVLRQMLPSTLGRALLRPLVTEGVALETVPEPVVALELVPVPVPEPVSVSLSVSVPEPELASAPAPRPPEPAEPATPARPKPRILEPTFSDLERAVQSVDAVRREFESTQDLPLYAPRFMQLQLVEWIARARYWQDRVRDPAIEGRVTALAGEFGKVAKAYWPGNVPPLRLDATPATTGQWLARDTLKGWDEAAEVASELIARPVATLDDYGWADGTDLDPAPPDASGRLGDAVTRFASCLGDHAGDPDSPALRRAVNRWAPPPFAELLRVARELRWLRGQCADVLRWAKLLGRLRFTVQLLRLGEAHELSRTLDAETRPPRTWAALLDYDPKRRERHRQNRELMSRLPPSEAAPSELVSWFIEAARLFPADELASRLLPRKNAVLALVAATLEGSDLRQARDRLRAVQKRLHAGDVVPIVEAGPDLVEDASRPTVPEPTPVDLARQRVAGRSALVVTNRADPNLQRALESRLELVVTWADVNQSSSVDSQTQRIKHGGFDLVIGASGFISHPDEWKLKDACRAADVPYVSAGKCRLVGCSLAILRDVTGARQAA